MRWLWNKFLIAIGVRRKPIVIKPINDGSIDPPPTIEPDIEPDDYKGILFPDISRYRLCNFKKFKGKHLIFKATEGTYKVDPTFEKNVKGCNENNIKFGVYHFYRWDINPARQAEFFLKSVGINLLKHCYHLPIVDFESARRQSNRNLLDDLNDLKIFIKAVNRHTGRKMRVYVGDNLLGQIKDDKEMLELCDAPWVARYSSKAPKNDGVWDSIWAWQFTDDHYFKGIGGCDGNRFL